MERIRDYVLHPECLNEHTLLLCGAVMLLLMGPTCTTAEAMCMWECHLQTGRPTTATSRWRGVLAAEGSKA
jgi:hypothetical protein